MSQSWYKKASVQTALVSGAFLLLVTLVIQFSPKARLEKEKSDLEKEVQKLEMQLSPFRAIALQRFGGNGEEALSKLAAQVKELQTQLERATSIIRRFDVSAVAIFKGDWKSATPPDLSKLIRTAARGSDIRVELKTNDSDMRWIDFTESSGLKMASGEESWVLEYSAQAPAGSWILGENSLDLIKCGAIEMVLYGINNNVTKDSIVNLSSIVLTFYVNGIPKFHSEYQVNFKMELTDEHNPQAKIHLNGPAELKQIR